MDSVRIITGKRQKKDVKFIRYEPNDKPQVEAVEAEGRSVLRVAVTDPILGMKLAIDADCLAFAAAVIAPEGNGEISQFFKVSLGPDGFFKEAHVKLRPVDFSAGGVFCAGWLTIPNIYRKRLARLMELQVGH